MRISSRFAVIGLSLSVALVLSGAVKQPIKKPTVDPDIPAVNLFELASNGTVEVSVIAKNSQQANLFVTNKSADTVSVKLPKAVAAVHVLKQFGFPGAGVGGNNAGAGLGQGQGNGVGGQGQSVGGGMNGGARNANGQAFGQGIFSVPSNKTVQLPLKTVCLAHGQPEPQPRMTYKLVPIEDFTSNTTLHEVLKLFVSGEADQQTAQAAAWHLASGMTWEQLKAKKIDHLGGLQSTPFFTAKQVKAAEELVERAKKRVDAAAAEKPETTREERPATVSAR